MTTPSAIDAADLIALAQRLVRFPSPQTDLMEAEPAVQQFIGDCVIPILAARGLTGRRDKMGNLIIELGPKDAERSLVLMTYAMTHPASSMTDPFKGELVKLAEGEAVRGRGIAEQKGSLAAAIVATDMLNKAGKLRGRLIFALSSAGETGRHDAAKSILEAIGALPKVGIVAVGTNNKVALGNKGRIDIEVTVYGKATHSSTPWLGVNAIDGARQVLDRLAALSLGGEPHPKLGTPSLTSTRIETLPKATHTLQNEVRLTFDRRLLPGQDPEMAFDQVVKALADIPAPWRVEAKRGPFMYPFESRRDGLVYKAVAAARTQRGLPEPEPVYKHGALDAGYLAVRGCEAGMMGPGQPELFHTDSESLLVSDLVTGAEDYLGLIQNYFG